MGLSNLLEKEILYLFNIFKCAISRVLKAGYLMFGVLSNHFKVPVNCCWNSRVASIDNKLSLH